MALSNTLFRIHFHGGEQPIDLRAENPVEARKAAVKSRPEAVIKKIKVVKGD